MRKKGHERCFCFEWSGSWQTIVKYSKQDICIVPWDSLLLKCPVWHKLMGSHSFTCHTHVYPHGMSHSAQRPGVGKFFSEFSKTWKNLEITIRYDTIRDAILYVRSKADMSQLNLPHAKLKLKFLESPVIYICFKLRNMHCAEFVPASFTIL